MKKIPVLTGRILIEFLISVFVTVLFWSPAVLNPLNLSWLGFEDMKAAQLGWQYFCADGWHLPLGINQNYGLLSSSSIVYSDAVAPIAILMKFVFSKVIGCEFTYFGALLIFGNFMIIHLAQKFIVKINSRPIVLWSGTALILFSPVLTFFTQYYLALSAGLWVVLWTVLVYLEGDSRRWRLKWAALFFLGATYNFYIVGIIFVFYFFHLLKILHSKKASLRALVSFNLKLSILLLLFMFETGYFVLPLKNASTSGFGYYRSDLFSLINPKHIWFFKFGFYEPDKGLSEGVGYIGSGFILLGIIFAIRLASTKSSRNEIRNITQRYYKLIGPAVISLVLAISSNIVIFGFEVFSFNIPKMVTVILGTFRSSQRFYWPITIIFQLYLLHVTLYQETQTKDRKKVKRKNNYLIRNKKAQRLTFLMIAAAICQVIDSSSYWRFENLHSTQYSKQPAISTVKGFWMNLPGKYFQMIQLSGDNDTSISSKCATAAFYLKIPTNCVYLARVNPIGLEYYGNIEAMKFVKSSQNAHNIIAVPQEKLSDLESQLGPNPLNYSIANFDGVAYLIPGCATDSFCKTYLQINHVFRDVALAHG
jgi:Family of unknown function (DUF6311)